MRESKTKVHVAGVGMIGVLVGALLLTSAFYTRAFTRSADITLRTARSGLVMDPGNKVKLRGVEIGRVGAVRATGGAAELVLELDPGVLSRIPANVEAQIRSTTVFGAKYVELVTPAHPVSARLAAGAVIDSMGVTTEVNTVFKSLDQVLTGIDAADLNTTLTVLARTLDGRGSTIAAIATQANDYLTKLEPMLPQIRTDLVDVARFARLGNAISPALLRILENATVTSTTISTRQQALHRLLVDLSLLGGEGAKVLGINGQALGALLRALRPTASTLHAYASELPCFLQGLDQSRQVMARTFGGADAGLRARVSFRSGLPAYTAPKDLPTLPHGRGPDCRGLPVITANEAPFPEVGGPQ